MERLKELEQSVAELRAALDRLQGEVAALREAQCHARHPVETVLWQRGLPVRAHGDLSRTFLPPDSPPAARERFYRLMRRYSFRLFLRDLVQYPKGGDPGPLTRYCSVKTVRSYLGDLQELGVVGKPPEGGYELLSPRLDSFGPTLEWYVAEVFQREFMAPALFNIRLERTRSGGDYDVVALLRDALVYVEVKSSPPRGVELPAVEAFLGRIRDLKPQVAVFLVDTELRMADKMVPLFAEALARGGRGDDPAPIVRLVDELFHLDHALYIVNSRKGIYSNLRICLRDSLQKATGKVLCGK